MGIKEDEKQVGWKTKYAKFKRKPLNGSFVLLGCFNDGKEKWELYLHIKDYECDWEHLRLGRREKAGGRCHYTLAWSKEEQRFRQGRDEISLQINRPTLLTWVCDRLKERGCMRQDWQELSADYIV